MKSRDGVQLLAARRPETHIFDAERGLYYVDSRSCFLAGARTRALACCLCNRVYPIVYYQCSVALDNEKLLALYHVFTPTPAVPAIGKERGMFSAGPTFRGDFYHSTCDVGEKSAILPSR
jgi:hypothetical protein